VTEISRPRTLEALPAGYRALFESALNVFSSDPRVRALWVSGSLARGDADAASDLDLVASVDDASFDAFAAEWRTWLAAITPTVIAREIPFLRGSVYSLTPTCERLDVVVERASAVKNAFLPRAVVFDRDGLDARRPRPFPPAGPDPQKVAFAIEEPFRYLAMFPVLLGRSDFLLGQEAWGHLRRRLSEVFLEANAPLPTTGVKHWRDKLTPAQYAVLESLAWPEATREALVDAHVAILRAFVAHAKPIAERLGVPWPHALEDAVRTHWRRELGVEL
jgi:predicted nucleotidyltransferase